MIPAQPDDTRDLCPLLADRSKLTQERIHPFEIVSDMRRYEVGKWRDVPTVKTKPDREDVEGENITMRKTAISSWSVSDKVGD